jgi:hypothetical protein
MLDGAMHNSAFSGRVRKQRITSRRIASFGKFVHLQTGATGAIVSADFSAAFFDSSNLKNKTRCW